MVFLNSNFRFRGALQSPSQAVIFGLGSSRGKQWWRLQEKSHLEGPEGQEKPGEGEQPWKLDGSRGDSKRVLAFTAGL